MGSAAVGVGVADGGACSVIEGVGAGVEETSGLGVTDACSARGQMNSPKAIGCGPTGMWSSTAFVAVSMTMTSSVEGATR